MTTEIFDRQVRVTIGTRQLEGYRAAFTVTKTLAREPNTCELSIFNLPPDVRAEIGELTGSPQGTAGVPVEVEAGYRTTGGPQRIFLGNLRDSFSTRNGPTWETRIGSGDGERQQQISRIALSMPRHSSVKSIITEIAQGLELGLGNIEAFFAANPKAASRITYTSVNLDGSAAEQLDNWTRAIDASWSVQDGALQLLAGGKVAQGRVLELNPSSGLIGVPSVEAEGTLNAVALVIPGVDVGSVVVVDSDTVQGNFRIDSVEYRGDTHGGEFAVNIKGPRY